MRALKTEISATETHFHYESFGDFLDDCRNGEAHPDGCCDLVRLDQPSNWNGNITHDQAINLAEYGWPEGRAFLSSVDFDFDSHDFSFVEENETKILDVAGAVPDVPAFIAGDPCCMVDIVRSERPSKVIKMVVNIVTSWTVATSELKNFGGAVCSWIDHLESKGWSLELIVRFESIKKDYRLRLDVTVKKAGEILDLDRVLFMIAHPASQRRLFFHVVEMNPESKYLTRTFGLATDSVDVNGEIYVRHLCGGNAETTDDAVAYVSEPIKSQFA